MPSSSLPCVCFIEDDREKRRNLVDFHSEVYGGLFSLRFIVCEQQFQYCFNGQVAPRSQKANLVHPEVSYSYEEDGLPSVFVIDMMLQWESKFFANSSISRDSSWYTNRAGLRIGEQLHSSYGRQRGICWLYWSAVDCSDVLERLNMLRNVRKDVGEYVLYYKDSFRAAEMLKLVAGLLI